MKKIFALIILVSTALSAAACDICGCGAGSAYLGILPDFNSRIIGIRYRFNAVQTHVAPDGLSSYLTANEHYYTAELWGGWNVGKKIRLMAYLPVSYNTRKSQEEDVSKTGLGDAGAQVFFHILQSRKTLSSGLLVQDLWAGAGIKLPTGKYEPLDKEASGQSANLFQLGTGSFDFLASAMYDIRLQDAGLNVAASYKINTNNKYDYNYGNKWNANAQLYYKFRIKNAVTVAPNGGAGYERSTYDLDEGYKVSNSGGYILFGTLGAELSYKKLALGGNWQKPLSQDLALGVVRAQHKMMLHAAWTF